jgi:hypothetical protein
MDRSSVDIECLLTAICLALEISVVSITQSIHKIQQQNQDKLTQSTTQKVSWRMRDI